MTMKGRGPEPQYDFERESLQLIRATFRWIWDPDTRTGGADVTGWFRHPEVIDDIGWLLAQLVWDEEIDVVLAPQSRGMLLGALTAKELYAGLVELRKQKAPLSDTDDWLTARTPLDYRQRNLELSLRARRLHPGDRVVFVDDWIDTGGQLRAAHTLAEMAGANWRGAAVVVDGLSEPSLRYRYGVRSLFNRRDL